MLWSRATSEKLREGRDDCRTETNVEQRRMQTQRQKRSRRRSRDKPAEINCGAPQACGA